mgnify:CR=1 FL=1
MTKQHESMYSEADIRSQLRKVPKVNSPREALKHILKVATDKRGHSLLIDDNRWQEFKLRVIMKLARRGLRGDN